MFNRGIMKCNYKFLEAYLDSELDEEQKKAVEEHLQGCAECSEEIAILRSINNTLGKYEYQSSDDSTFINELYKIKYQQKKKTSYFNLFPRELAFSAMFIFLALYVGILFCMKTIDLNNSDSFQALDFYEDISLVSLLE